MAINVLGLDIGEKRIGVARVNTIARIPEPLAVLANDNEFIQQLRALITEHDISKIVVGLPRGLQGEETAQSAYTRQFVADAMQELTVEWQDETLSTVTAAERTPSSIGIDADAACIILEDYLQNHYEIS